jgi:ABC-type nitrate/sulfonate/bicarbonate transport system permease component
MKHNVFSFLFAIGLLLFVWGAVSYLGKFPDWQLPSPSIVGLELWKSWQSSDYLIHVRATFFIACLGFFLSIVVGTGVATILYFSAFLRKVITPLLLFSQNVPIIVLAPLLVVWFGFGIEAKLIVVILVCFFPITIALVDAFGQVDQNLLRYLDMSGATKWEKFRHLAFPSAIPVLFSSCKLSATYSVMGAVIAEWLGTEYGLGMIMTQAASSFRTDRVFVTILTIVVLSTCFFFFIRFIEQWWKHKRKLL